MTPEDFCQQMLNFPGDGKMTISPGPFQIMVGQDDIMAAKLLDWLFKHLDMETTTMGQALAILDAAHWWLQFWAAQPREDEVTA
jgi:hypothetical protein